MNRIDISNTLIAAGFHSDGGCYSGHSIENFTRGNLHAIVETFDQRSVLLPEPRVYFEVAADDDNFDMMVKDFCKGDDFFLPPKAGRKK